MSKRTHPLEVMGTRLGIDPSLAGLAALRASNGDVGGTAGGLGMSLADLLAILVDTKSATHRALVSLAKFGMVTQIGRRGT